MPKEWRYDCHWDWDSAAPDLRLMTDSAVVDQKKCSAANIKKVPEVMILGLSPNRCFRKIGSNRILGYLCKAHKLIDSGTD